MTNKYQVLSFSGQLAKKSNRLSNSLVSQSPDFSEMVKYHFRVHCFSHFHKFYTGFFYGANIIRLLPRTILKLRWLKHIQGLQCQKEWKKTSKKDAIIVETGEDRRGTDEAEQNQFK